MKERTLPDFVVADRIQSVFDEYGLTDKQVADALGFDRKTIMAYRHCVSSPHISLIQYLTKTYDIDLYWLMNIRKESK